MRLFARIVGGLCVAVILLLFAGAGWFYVYSGDLPDVQRLSRFAPESESLVNDDECLAGSIDVIPLSAIEPHLVSAVRSSRQRAGSITIENQLALSMFCASSRKLSRHFAEARVAVRLKRKFTQDQLLTIYLNRAFYGTGIIGIKAASQAFFHKTPNQLELQEAALLAALPERALYLSPYKHPDRAIKRRNEILDGMAASGFITAAQAETARAQPLGTTENKKAAIAGGR